MEPINWSESGIIVKQLVVVIVALASLLGVAFTPEEVGKITALVSAVVILGFSLWTIHARISKPCPPIAPKNNENLP